MDIIRKNMNSENNNNNIFLEQQRRPFWPWRPPPTGWSFEYLCVFAWEGRVPSKSTIAQYYNDNKNNCRTMPRAEVSLERSRSSSFGGAFVARRCLGRLVIAAATAALQRHSSPLRHGHSRTSCAASGQSRRVNPLPCILLSTLGKGP